MANAESAGLRQLLAQARAALPELRAQADTQAQQHAQRYSHLRDQAVAQVRLDARQRAELIAQLAVEVEWANRAEQALAGVQGQLAPTRHRNRRLRPVGAPGGCSHPGSMRG